MSDSMIENHIATHMNAHTQNQINVYSEYIQGEPLIEDDQVGKQIADWLVINKIPEEIFGPNLHVEVSGELVLNV